MRKPTTMTPARIADEIIHECENVEAVIFFVGGVKETHTDEEREHIALALWKILESSRFDADAYRRIHEAARRINPYTAPQACMTCHHIFTSYDRDGGCPRCGSQDCGVLDALVPEEPCNSAPEARTFSTERRFVVLDDHEPRGPLSYDELKEHAPHTTARRVVQNDVPDLNVGDWIDKGVRPFVVMRVA